MKNLWNRKPAGNFFPLPNALFRLNLLPGEIAVYAYLMFRENRQTYQCHPSYATIGRAIHMSPNTVRKYVSSLVEKRLIYTEPTSIITKKGEKRNGSLLYTIRPYRMRLTLCGNRRGKTRSRNLPARSWKSCGFRRVENQAGERKVVCGHLPTYRVGQCPPLLKIK